MDRRKSSYSYMVVSLEEMYVFSDVICFGNVHLVSVLSDKRHDYNMTESINIY